MMKTKIISLLALTLCVGAFLFSTPAYASAEPTATAEPADVTGAETLTVNAVWLEGDTLHIEFSDKNTGADQSLTLNLKDYAGVNDEYVTVQAIDRAGNKSNAIQFKNPYYKAPSDPPASPAPGAEPSSGQSESGVPNGGFTPDGSGTVLDNAINSEGKEFFTIEAEDGAVFYLIVDRDRNQDNVYFLNAVTEQDLLSLAKPGDGTTESGIPANPTPTQTVAPTPEPTPEPSPPPANSGGMNTGAIAFIIIAALAAGGAGYYFKILKPRKLGASEPEEDYEEPGDDYADDDGDFEDDAADKDGEEE